MTNAWIVPKNIGMSGHAEDSKDFWEKLGFVLSNHREECLYEAIPPEGWSHTMDGKSWYVVKAHTREVFSFYVAHIGEKYYAYIPHTEKDKAEKFINEQ